MLSRLIRAFALVLALGATPALAEAIKVDHAGAQALAAEGVPIIDIRTPGEWQATGVIEGSHLLTFFDEKGEHDAAAWLAALDRIAPDGGPVALICAAGNRSSVVSEFLSKQVGRKGVYNVIPGLNGWKKAGGPVVAPSKN